MRLTTNTTCNKGQQKIQIETNNTRIKFKTNKLEPKPFLKYFRILAFYIAASVLASRLCCQFISHFCNFSKCFVYFCINSQLHVAFSPGNAL